MEKAKLYQQYSDYVDELSYLNGLKLKKFSKEAFSTMLAGVDVTGFEPWVGGSVSEIGLYGFIVDNNNISLGAYMDPQGEKYFSVIEQNADRTYRRFEVGFRPTAVYTETLANGRNGVNDGPRLRGFNIKWQDEDLLILFYLRKGLSEIANNAHYSITDEDREFVKGALGSPEFTSQELKEEIKGFLDSMSLQELANLRNNLSTSMPHVTNRPGEVKDADELATNMTTSVNSPQEEKEIEELDEMFVSNASSPAQENHFSAGKK